MLRLTGVAQLCICLGLNVPASAQPRASEVNLLRPGIELSLVAQDPALVTPTGVDVDDQGRVWVVSTHTHFRPDDYVGPEHDEVVVFTDREADGSVDQRQVFYSATEATMDLELGPDDWVYLAERDRILRVKDRNDDEKGDVEEELIKLETTADYPHNGLEGLAWHPAGDLVFGIGENFAQRWTMTGTDGRSVSGTGEGGIFRVAPDGTNLRRIARGFWNPFGICVRADGEIFAAENDPGERPPCRLLHIVEGGNYGYQRTYGPEAHHPFVAWNGELRGTLPMIRPSGEAPCAVLPLGRGLLVPSWSDHRLDFFQLRRSGASFDADRIELLNGSRYFRPTCMAPDPTATGNKRAWYLCDWVDGRYQAHGFGRLWKLEIDLDEAEWVGPLEPEPMTDQARLASDLRSGKASPNRETLMELAQGDEPFIAQAALLRLSDQAKNWRPADVTAWPPLDRACALHALKMAGASPLQWVREFLKDPNADVQFEALRWLADAELGQLLPQVQDYLNRSDLDYRRFEAAVATLNTLTGRAQQGVRHPEMLLARVKDEQSAPQVRAFALRLLPKQPRSASKNSGDPAVQFPKGLNLELLEKLLDVDSPKLTLEVIRSLAANPAVGHELLAKVAADDLRTPRLRAEAVAGLAAVAHEHAGLLVKLAGDSERIVREESLRCLRSIELTSTQAQYLRELAARHRGSADLYEAAVNPESLAVNRPDPGSVAAWAGEIAAVEAPVDVASGERIFHHARLAQCANCHRHNGRGNVVGPDLSQLGRRDDRRWLLKSILQPSAEMAPEYQPRTVLLNDGRTFTGIRLRSSTKEAMRDANGQNRVFDRDEIDAMVESEVSFMPTGLVNALTTRELRDLIAFLENETPVN